MLCWNKWEIPGHKGHLKFHTESWLKGTLVVCMLGRIQKRQKQQDDSNAEGKCSLPLHIQICFLDLALHISPHTTLGQSQWKAYWHCRILVWLEKGGATYPHAPGASQFSSLAWQQGEKTELCNIYHIYLCVLSWEKTGPTSTDTMCTHSQPVSAIQSL